MALCKTDSLSFIFPVTKSNGGEQMKPTPSVVLVMKKMEIGTGW